MPFWFIVCFIAALIGLFASFSSALIFYTSIVTLGLAAPVWTVAANLWLILLLVAPWVYFNHNGKARKGLWSSAALLTMGLVAFYGVRAMQLASFATPTLIASPTSPIRSIEISDPAGAVFEGGTCGDLCQKILSGNDLDWLRMISGNPAQSTVIRRVDSDTCPAPCLQTAPDPGSPADIRMAIEIIGDGSASREQLSGLAVLLSRQRFTVNDLRSGELLRDQSRNLWLQADFPLPLHINVGFDGNGLHGGGVTFPWQRKSDPDLNIGTALDDLGLTLGPKPDVTPLIASLMDLQETDPGGPRGLQIIRWLQGFRDGHAPQPAERILLRRAPSLPGLQSSGLENLMARFPDLFIADFRTLYDQVASSDQPIANRAALVILLRLTNDPPGTHDTEAALYLNALNSPNQRKRLLSIVGRYGFDPTPFLQEALLEQDDYRLVHVTYAACLSDPRWAATLAPFIHAQMLPLLSDPQGRNQNVLQLGNATLVNLGRRDLAQDLRNRMGWDKVMQDIGHNMRPVPDMEGLQANILGSLTGPVTCQPPVM